MKKQTEPLSWTLENEAFGKGAVVCGTDEAGRGPLAGPVYAAAVILDYNDRDRDEIVLLNDSKKLTEKKRFELAPRIKEAAVSYCVAYSTVEEIESTDILSASLHAMRKAIDGLGFAGEGLSEDRKKELDICCLGGRSIKPNGVLVDGCISRDFSIPAKAIVGGDGISPAIAAASILAKTERDLYCTEVLDKNYPEYLFAKHKGYGTKDHYAAVDKYGLCKEHRASFFKKYFDRKNGES